MNQEIEQVREYLRTPWIFHNWLRQKLPWSTAIGAYEFQESLLQRFLYEKGYRGFLVFDSEVVFFGENYCEAFLKLPPWAEKFQREVKGETLFSERERRVSVFQALKTLYRVEGEYVRHPDMRRK